MPPYGGPAVSRPRRPGGPVNQQPAQPEPPPPTPPEPPPPTGTPDSGRRGDAGPALAPRIGDGGLWVSPRPALPATVAHALYGQEENKDSIAVRRLRAMVDSLNIILDQEQRERQKPTWTTNVAGKAFGIDSQYIHIAGIKIPTAALALLPINLPQGNYDEMMRARHLEDMRQDILRAAARAETYQDFRRYVRELRERKDAEREFQRRQREKPDTVKAVP
jgi:hypothetical protein